MKSKVCQNLFIIAATAVAPMGLLAYVQMKTAGSELLNALMLYLVAHTLIWLVLIPAFRRFPRTSWTLCTLLYPLITYAGMMLLINPLGALIGLIWFGPYLYIGWGWITIPTSFIIATIAYILTRTKPDTDNNRGIAAPTK